MLTACLTFGCSYWLMHFDANPSVLKALNHSMNIDERVFRATFIKLGDKLDDIVRRPDKSKIR